MQNNSEIVIYQSQDGQAKLDVRLDGDTVWLTQEQMADLFDRDRTAINRHINNIFAEGELDKNVVCADFAHTTSHGAIEGKTQTRLIPYYNLDVVSNSVNADYEIQNTDFEIAESAPAKIVNTVYQIQNLPKSIDLSSMPHFTLSWSHYIE